MSTPTADPPPAGMRRVSVVGVPGSGKTTFGRRLAGSLGVPFIELDSIFHLPEWQELPRDEFGAKVATVIAGDGWVVDGNYSAVRDLVWERADTVVWINLSRAVVMRRVVARTIRRAVTREELWNGNREPLSNFYKWDPMENIIRFAWVRYAASVERYSAAMEDPRYAGIRFVRLRSAAEVEAFGRALTP
jgi:adenylate kinase family enzyme